MKPKNRTLAVVCLALLTLPCAFAVTLHGTLYDSDLDPVKDAIVEVNTIPLQRTVAADGGYVFTIPPGNYTITALINRKGEYLQDKEPIVVKGDGNYTLDLFLFPVANVSESNDLEGLDEDLAALATYQDENQLPLSFFLGGIIVAALIIGVVLYLSWKKQHPSPPAVLSGDITADDTPSLILKLMKEAGGRMTQKDIRQKLPYSEAKISLAITELEHQGKVQKIKKGRGNILIVK